MPSLVSSAAQGRLRVRERRQIWIRPMQAQVTTKAMIASADGS